MRSSTTVSRRDPEGPTSDERGVLHKALLVAAGSLLASGAAIGIASALAKDPKAARSALGLVAGIGVGYVANRARAFVQATSSSALRALAAPARRVTISERATVRAAAALVGLVPNERKSAAALFVRGDHLRRAAMPE
jgi:hypothetical protein